MRLTMRLFTSSIKNRPFYVSTPIFYVNAAPHLGHLYSAIVADTIQRFEKMVDPDCNIIFSTGTDEHGTKIQQAAANSKQSLPDYCTNISNEYKQMFKEFDVEYTDFVRTTESRHKTAVTKFWNKLVKEEYIYKAKYSGWYSVNDESFVPETHVKEELKDGEKVRTSLESGHKVEWTEETNYMFRLSAFKTHLQEWLKTDGVITPFKYQKQLQDMLANETYFPDISVSRPSSRVHWAIRVPNDPEQSIYVWLDALVNYLTVCGLGEGDEVMKARRGWPADVQVVGKDILKFHGVYWPAFLMACGRPPPRRLLVHAHWTVAGHKMSKSLHNVVCPRRAPAPPPALRYALLREATMHDDANYSETKMVNIANSELADTLGNLASRCLGRALNPRAEFPALRAAELRALAARPAAATLLDAVERLPDICRGHYSSYQFYKAADAIMGVLHRANGLFEALRPWELAARPDARPQVDVALHVSLETLRVCGLALRPMAPSIADRLLDQLRVDKDCRSWAHSEVPSWRQRGAIYEAKNLREGKFVLFQRIYKKNDTVQKNADKKIVQKKKANLS